MTSRTLEGRILRNRVSLHKGAFLGIAPTGKQVTWNEMHILRFANGQAVEHWGNVDQLSILQQLGVIPAAGWKK